MRRTGRRHRVVIVGGGFAGLNAARDLAAAPVRVTLIDRRNFHLFQPLLYQVATGTLAPDEIAPLLRGALRGQRNANVVLGEVRSIDPDRREVVLTDDERIGWDTLIVATGSSTFYFGHEDWESWAPGLKTVEEAMDIRRRIVLAFESAEREPDAQRRAEWLTFVVVGGGATGVELAGALAEIARHSLRGYFRRVRSGDARVLLLEAGPRIFPTFPEHLAVRATQELARLGVEVRTGALVTALGPRDVTIGTGDGRTSLATRTVFWAAGVRGSALGRSLQAAGAELDRQGRVLVGPDLALPSDPSMLVLGDLARANDRDGAPLPGTAPVAIQQGRYAAELIRARLEGRPTEPFAYLDKGMLATIGRGAGVGRIGRWNVDGSLAWALWLGVHLWYLLGVRNRAVVLLKWAWTFFTRRRGSLILTGRAATADVPAPRSEAPLAAADPVWDEEARAGVGTVDGTQR